LGRLQVIKKDHFEKMAKELIVSVNGREKKIAIIENERVTEFYIERGEDNQGIVGNIYKGRVMRVLPGMQSAFVDIGLERDAFLYVSDFFDEEEEYERIVMDKSKKVDSAAAQLAAKEHIEAARVEREQKIENTQERAEPLLEVENPSVAELVDDEEPEEPAAFAVEEIVVVTPSVAAVSAATGDATRDGESGGRRRSRRGRRRGKGLDEPQFVQRVAVEEQAQEPETEKIDSPFALGGDSFERVVDEDEIAAEDGAMFKDARVQEKIFDQIHAVEFDLDDVPTVEVGSILQAELPTNDSFQRIDDSEEAIEGAVQRAAQEAVAARVESFVDEVFEDTPGARSFERVSDDDPAEKAELATVEPERPAKRGRGARRSKKAEETIVAEGIGAEPETPEIVEAGKGTASKPAKAGKTAKQSARKSAPKKAAAGKSKSRRTTGTVNAASDSVMVPDEEGQGDGGEEAPTSAESYADAEASIAARRERAEFATRRGGRRRRRPGKPDGQSGEGDRDRLNGKDEEGPAIPEKPEAVVAPPVVAVAPQIPAVRDRQQNVDQRPHRSSGGGGGGGQRRDRQQPTITDLLREGQEILVQIAKEPIAKKGARITSHIALPGRFLVYMPTVEHVGVSRKIESDSERQRLRRLIQAIRAEEDVPSGGFIVRTAGVGISEEDLRDDARYLVRTWLEIRRNAEKTKPATVVHQDLDLVQRLLRDQLSDDFSAIRVDSEEEYTRIVEFINRIQPRMVKRVKLHTRAEPILETYGVQAEIDKAIKPRVWLRSGGYLVINQTEALVAIDVNTGKFVGRGGTRLEDTITRTNMEAVEEIVRQIRLRDLGGIIVLDLIDMEDRRNRNRVMQALQEALQHDKSPTKVLSFNDFGLVIMTRKRVKQSLERTMCSPCPYCVGAGLVKSPQTICYEILEEARRLGRSFEQEGIKQTTLRVNPEVGKALRSTEKDVLAEIEDYLGPVDLTSDGHVHQEQFDFAFI
jgi:ribonuclease G